MSQIPNHSWSFPGGFHVEAICELWKTHSCRDLGVADAQGLPTREAQAQAKVIATNVLSPNHLATTHAR